MINCFVLQEPNLSLLRCAIFFPAWLLLPAALRHPDYEGAEAGQTLVLCQAPLGLAAFTTRITCPAGRSVLHTAHLQCPPALLALHCGSVPPEKDLQQRSRQMNYHRMIEYSRLEGICRDHWVQLCCIHVLAKMHTF